MRFAALVSMIAAAAMAQPPQSYVQRAWFTDGSCLEFYTQASGSTTPVSTQGGLMLEDNTIHRIVLDKNNSTIYAYDVEAKSAGDTGEVFIRLKPVKKILRSARIDPGKGTLAEERVFPAVKRGQAVVLDILQNPATGEKIYDVICPIDAPNPSESRGLVASGGRINQELSLRDMEIVVDGMGVLVPPTPSVTGAALYVFIPGRGSYFLSTQPSAKYEFKPAGSLAGNVLSFTARDQHISLISKSPILKTPEYLTIWVYHLPDLAHDLVQKVDELKKQMAELSKTYTPDHPKIKRLQAQIDVIEAALSRNSSPAGVTVRAADSVESLLPKK